MLHEIEQLKLSWFLFCLISPKFSKKEWWHDTRHTIHLKSCKLMCLVSMLSWGDVFFTGQNELFSFNSSDVSIQASEFCTVTEISDCTYLDLANAKLNMIIKTFLLGIFLDYLALICKIEIPYLTLPSIKDWFL